MTSRELLKNLPLVFIDMFIRMYLLGFLGFVMNFILINIDFMPMHEYPAKLSGKHSIGSILFHAIKTPEIYWNAAKVGFSIGIVAVIFAVIEYVWPEKNDE